MLSETASSSTFDTVLVSPGPSPEIPRRAAAVYDWLVGDWEADVYDYGEGRVRTSKGEWHFSWVLEGRAIQDVWIVPKRLGRNGSGTGDGNRYGTTLRIYDPKIDAWRVFWFNPVTQDRSELIAKRIGNTIVQESATGNSLTRWIFADIKPDSFIWRGQFSTDGGKTWQLDSEFHVRRVTHK